MLLARLVAAGPEGRLLIRTGVCLECIAFS